MRFYFAPLEGITGYVFRGAYQRHFGQVDAYFSPFISTTQKRAMRPKELRDILPEHNEGIALIPQILSNNGEDFVATANFIESLGYKEVNLNLGCPARTVVSKGKGSGFLDRPVALNRFLDYIYSHCTVDISIKTRLGIYESDEFEELLKLFNEYPVKELTIHPRVQKDFYNNHPDLDAFAWALEKSKNPVCYNGDIFTPEDYKKFRERFPLVEAVMLGRGLLANPNLVNEIKNPGSRATKEELKNYLIDVRESYEKVLSGETPVLHKMKEIWCYFDKNFEDCDKLTKKLRKSKTLNEYKQIVNEIFLEKSLCE